MEMPMEINERISAAGPAPMAEDKERIMANTAITPIIRVTPVILTDLLHPLN
jgi:hypothetical protein